MAPHASEDAHSASTAPLHRAQLLGAQGWNDGCGVPCTDAYEQNMVNLIQDLRKEWNNPTMAVSIPVSGFGGWAQENVRRLGIINAQFGACNATRHPGMAHCIAEETRGFFRPFNHSPVNQVRADAETACHARRSAALSSWDLGRPPCVEDVMKPCPLRTVCKGGRHTRRKNKQNVSIHSSL